MKTKISFLGAGMFLAALVNGFGQSLITRQPQSVTNLAGTTATFSVSATGTPPLAYQWLFNSMIALAAATNADLILRNVQSFSAGGYSVVVTNVEGAVTSAVASLTVLTPPKFIRQPADQTASKRVAASHRVHGERGNEPMVKCGRERTDCLLPVEVGACSTSAPCKRLHEELLLWFVGLSSLVD